MELNIIMKLIFGVEEGDCVCNKNVTMLFANIAKTTK